MTSRRSPLGTVLAGTYRLTRLIAEGGMGTVYEAVQVRLNRRFAVKLLTREAAGNPEALARFRREAEVTAKLAHPHIIQVADYGATEEGDPYLVMEYLDGEDLEQRLRRVGRFNLASAVRVVHQVASAVSASHALGIVHRDLKPANIFLLDIEGEPDFVKVVDFGISKFKRANTQITGTSVLMGTPSYMPPEQATGKSNSADHRADQWALGAVAWEMLTGRPPFVRKDVTALLHAIAHEELPPMTDKLSALPTEVETTLRRALAKRPGDRFPTVGAFARAFETAAASPLPVVAAPRGGFGRVSALFRKPAPNRPVAAPRKRSLGRRRGLWMWAVGIALPVAAGAAYLVHANGGLASVRAAAADAPTGASASQPIAPVRPARHTVHAPR